MDSKRLKRIDRYLGTPLILLLAAWDRLVSLAAPSRSRRGRDLSGISRIAVVKTIAIGDVTVALASVASIRERFPDAHITFIVTPRVREVVEGLPFVDEIMYYDVFGAHSGIGGVARFAREVRARRFEMWIELEHYYRFTTILGYLSGARVRVGFDTPGQVRKKLFTISVPYRDDVHERESFLEIPRALGSPREPEGYVPIPVSEADERVVETWLREALSAAGAGAAGGLVERARQALEAGAEPLPLVLLHTSTSPVATTRRWVDERWAELARTLMERCRLLPVLTGIEGDLPALRSLADLVGGAVLIAAGRLDLKQFSVLARRSALVVSVDTGPLHVAAATGVPTVGLYGSTLPSKWGPFGDHGAYVWAHIACAPCTQHWLGNITTCTKSDCMLAISVQDVLGAIASIPSAPCPLPEERASEPL